MALAVAVLALLLTGGLHGRAIQVGGFQSLKHLRTGDSRNYLQDALVVQHKLFNHAGPPAERTQRVFDENNFVRRSYGEHGVRFPDRLLAPLVWAVLFEFTGEYIPAAFWWNVFIVACAVALVSYVAVREFGLFAGIVTVLAYCAIRGGATLPTLLLEPTVCGFLAALAFAGWLVLRHPTDWRAIGLLAAVALVGTAVKSAVWPLCFLAHGLCAGSLAYRFRRARAPFITVPVAALSVLVLLQVGQRGLRRAIQAGLDIPPHIMSRSNGPYALWMGSLPSAWTGSYAGRLSSKTYAFFKSPRCEHEEYRRQGLQGYDRYWVTLDRIGPDIRDNYENCAIDAVKRFTFRHTKMLGINGFENRNRAIVAAAAVAGATAVLLLSGPQLLPWVIVWQAILWMHTLSRYRARDVELLQPITALLAAAGIHLIVTRVLGWRRRRIGYRRRSLHHLAVLPLVALIWLPLALALVFPDTQNTRGPTIRELAYCVTEGEEPQLNVRANVGAPNLFGYLQLDSFPTGKLKRMVMYDQANQDGWLEFSVTVPPAAVPPDTCRWVLYVWSLNSRQSKRELQPEHQVRPFEVGCLPIP